MPHIKNSISRWLSEIQKAIKEHTEATKKKQQTDARERQQQAESEAKSVVRLPVEVTEYYRSEQSDRPIQDRRDRVRLWLEIIGVIVALAIAVSTLWSLFIFNGQLKEMQRQTEISERPWLSVEATPVSDLTFVNGKQPALSLKFSIKNVGKSIAKGVQISVKMFPTKATSIPIAPDAVKHQSELCDHIQPTPIKQDLFPTSEPIEQQLSISALPAATEAQAVSVPGAKPRSFVNFYIVGCVNYRSSFSTEIRQTRFAYYLIRPTPRDENHKVLIAADGTPLMFGFEVGIDVPNEQITMMKDMLASNDAN